ncbi:uncharacterized protein [Physcomitrium patens]|uniref:Uncharacterized protein n=1 Tax=Physcomitrium patens TaxID=3218 RepID=A0A2K1IXG9_PHYPA|nr:hypothetical protein PHYPA_023791 [Physcomitrium patens]
MTFIARKLCLNFVQLLFEIQENPYFHLKALFDLAGTDELLLHIQHSCISVLVCIPCVWREGRRLGRAENRREAAAGPARTQRRGRGDQYPPRRDKEKEIWMTQLEVLDVYRHNGVCI